MCYFKRNKMIPKGMPKKQSYFQSTSTTTNSWVRKSTGALLRSGVLFTRKERLIEVNWLNIMEVKHYL